MIARVINIYRTSFTGLSKETWLLSIVMLINRSGTMAVPFMSLYVTQYLHHPPSDAGLIITLYGVGSFLGAVAGGKLTDIIGFRPIQISTSIIGGLLFLLFSNIKDFYILCTLTVVMSFVAEAFRPANFTAIASYAAKGLQTRSYSLNRLAINLGWAVGGSLGGIIASINYKLLFQVDGAVNIIAGLSIFWLLPAAQKTTKKLKEKIENTSVQKPWQDILFVKFILLTTIYTTCFFLMFRLVPLFFKEEWHMNESNIGLLLGMNGVLVALFEMVLVSRLENRKSPMFFIIIGVMLTLISYLLLMLPSFLPMVVATLSIILITFGEMLTLPFINGFVMSRSNQYNRGQYAAGYILSWSVAQIVGPTGGFYIVEKLNYNWLWLIIAILLTICAYGYNILKNIK